MKRWIPAFILLSGLFAAPLVAQDFNGTFVFETDSGTDTLVMRQDAQGNKTFLDGQRWYVVENNVCP